MKLVKVDDLQVGMILHDCVYRNEDQVMMVENTVLTERAIKAIRQLGLTIIKIKSDVEIEKPKFVVKMSLNQKFGESVKKYHEICKKVVLGKQPLYSEIQESIDPLVETIMNDAEIAMKLWHLQSTDFYTYEHSVKVSILSAVIGKWLGADDQKIKDLAMTGMLHDIGKCNIPNEILNKPDTLTENEFKIMKTHPTLGYILSKQIGQINGDIQNGVLQHHERYDGSGYPAGLEGEKIHEYARIVSVADVFDAMTSDRIYRSSKNPLYVLSAILDNGYSALDPYISRVFVQKSVRCFVGCPVRLNNGEIARIIQINEKNLMKPLIETSSRFINLVLEKEYEIVELLDYDEL